jgi:hypothetical protein
VGNSSILPPSLYSCRLPLVYSFLLYYLQLLLTKVFFVGDTNNKHMVIKNL